LPRTLRRGVRRIRRTSAQLRDLATTVGLSVLHESGAGTDNDEFVFAKVRR
jgi:hypothetical protein